MILYYSMDQHRKLFIGGNWKSNNTTAQTKALVEEVLKKLKYDSDKLGKLEA